MKHVIVTIALLLTGSAALASTYEYGWDRPGFDYANFAMMSPRFVVCEWQCEKDWRCKAWTYVKPGVQGPQAHCWLKWAVPRAVKNPNCTSGVM